MWPFRRKLRSPKVSSISVIIKGEVTNLLADAAKKCGPHPNLSTKNYLLYLCV